MSRMRMKYRFLSSESNSVSIYIYRFGSIDAEVDEIEGNCDVIKFAQGMFGLFVCALCA